MPKKKDRKFQRRVRERMQKTGESYTSARSHLTTIGKGQSDAGEATSPESAHTPLLASAEQQRAEPVPPPRFRINAELAAKRSASTESLKNNERLHQVEERARERLTKVIKRLFSPSEASGVLSGIEEALQDGRSVREILRRFEDLELAMPNFKSRMEVAREAAKRVAYLQPAIEEALERTRAIQPDVERAVAAMDALNRDGAVRAAIESMNSGPVNAALKYLNDGAVHAAMELVNSGPARAVLEHSSKIAASWSAEERTLDGALDNLREGTLDRALERLEGGNLSAALRRLAELTDS